MWGRNRLPLAALLALVLALALGLPAGAGAQSQQPQPAPRIVGGSQTTIGQYPWQAAVVFNGGGSAFNRQFCGGSVVTQSIVLTAAHCVYDTDPDCLPLPGLNLCLPGDPGGDGTKRMDPNDVEVVLGRTTLSNTSQGVELGVQGVSYQTSPAYNPSTVQNDVGYLVLASPAPAAQTPIDIAGSGEGAVWAAGVVAEITGWGSTSPHTGSPLDPVTPSDTLRVASVPILPDSTCGSRPVYDDLFDPNTMLCAGDLNGGTDTCFGDSGGPLQTPLAGGGYRLAGITSWGFGCAQKNSPGVYARVAGSALRGPVAAKVAELETSFGLPHENVLGSGGQPKGGSPPPATGGGTTAQTTVATPKDPFAKCRKAKTKSKRKRCNRKVRRALGR
jgi:secreted trypsin-like serine protease